MLLRGRIRGPALRRPRANSRACPRSSLGSEPPTRRSPCRSSQLRRALLPAAAPQARANPIAENRFRLEATRIRRQLWLSMLEWKRARNTLSSRTLNAARFHDTPPGLAFASFGLTVMDEITGFWRYDKSRVSRSSRWSTCLDCSSASRGKQLIRLAAS